MKRFFIVPALVLSLASVPALVGCDRTVSEENVKKTNPDGSSVQKKEETVQKSDGTVEKKSEKTSVDSDGDVKKTEKTEVEKKN